MLERGLMAKKLGVIIVIITVVDLHTVQARCSINSTE